MNRLRQLRVLSRTTFTEAVQQPAALLLTLCGIAATALVPLLQFHQFGEPGQLARDGGLAYQMTLGLALAVTAAGAALHAELASGTAGAALSKPVDRGLFLLGKFLGVLRLVAMFWFCLLCATLLAERGAERLETLEGGLAPVTDLRTLRLLLATPAFALGVAAWLHRRRAARFGVAAFHGLWILLAANVLLAGCFARTGDWAPYRLSLDTRILPVSLLVLAALAVFAALATALATRLKPGPVLLTCVLLLGLGLAADALLDPTGPAARRLAARTVPNLQNFWLPDALAHGGRLPGGYLPRAAASAVAWCAVALGAGMLAFRNRDLD